MTTWPDVSPISITYSTAVWQAVCERLHACGMTYKVDVLKFARFPCVNKHLTYDFCVWVRRAIYAMIPHFVNLDYNYAADEWISFPVYLTRRDVVNSIDTNIALMPARHSPAGAFVDFLTRARNVLDVLVATVPQNRLRCSAWMWGWSPNMYEDEGGNATAAIESAKSRVEHETTQAPRVDPESAIRIWDVSRSWQEAWSADTRQEYNVYFRHVSPRVAMPVIVAKNPFTVQDERHVFDGLGTDWLLGENELEPLAPQEQRTVDSNSAVLTPTITIPSFDLPEMPYVETIRCGYKLVIYLDWRVEGGYEFYTVEEEE